MRADVALCGVREEPRLGWRGAKWSARKRQSRPIRPHQFMPTRQPRKASHPRARRHPTPFILVDAAQGEPLHRQLYDAIRAAIVSGRLPAGSRLPSSRGLATDTGVSRVTVGVAFDQLRAEGYLEARAGSGTFVRAGLPDDALHTRRRRQSPSRRATPSAAESPTPRVPPALVQAHSLPVHRTAAIAFMAGVPALDLLPSALWGRLSARRSRSAVGEERSRLLDYANPAGYYPLSA
jgi:GntR family transcriptional regulator/MocR family aminotransferase